MGKDKQQQRRAAVAAKNGVGQNTLGQLVDSMSAPKRPATPRDTSMPQKPSITVGTEVQVAMDYLDMESAPEDDGLAHCGYLVLKAGEKLRILYMGSAETGDNGWLYGEVVLSLRVEPIGRRGWLPVKVIEPAAVAPALAQAVPARGVITKAAAGSAGPPPPPAQKCQPAVATQGAALSGANARPPGPSTKPSRAVAKGEAFPPLPGARAVPASAGGEGKAEDAAPAPQVDSQAKREAAAAAIARQRAAAAAAAAAASAKKAPGSEDRCPICMGVYTGAGHRRTKRPCCGVELCVQCDHKSLRSKRCYFCREDGDEYPVLALACRVAT
mmetsp:Transcript_11962/g.28045  ORF Transcript_11962/g.28045 Transcript_11962/m.28045 type:complete len:328 (+) Transcript_11962:71-1054(+)|eukprot:CAMPEP_0171071690 /NCGR_PEP_ID=MMETSP0766_2-20121228/10455_1 /TAXON_ID=439317 /ORGANISM="Gambierdiscus australes, Strain CAWD 149" /LENGTH=327 /DNA_ID=CAMNT_0011528239 /DNA_START=71 /DNA_END=1054 /DNA_ORIENTATION=+